MIRFIHGYPALYIPKEKCLTIADLHIGIEYALQEIGITIPSQTDYLKKRISSLINLTKAKKLVILGDVKHEVKGLSIQEFKEIPDIFSFLASKISVSIVRGNHDSYLSRVIPRDIDIYDSSGFIIGEYAFTHGQAWPPKESLDCKLIIMGHTHPFLEFWSESVRSAEPCWLRCPIKKRPLEEKYKKKCKLEEGIVMPAFNHLLGGVAFNSKRFKPSGPLLEKIFKLDESGVYLLDGTYLGELKNLRNFK